MAIKRKKAKPRERKPLYPERAELLLDLSNLMDRAGRLEMLKTMNCLHTALQIAGYEVADQMAGGK